MYERYAGLIFDMDGTILDTEPTHRKAWREVLGHYGLQYDSEAILDAAAQFGIRYCLCA